VSQFVVNRLILLALILLGVCLCVPKTQCHNVIRISMGDEHDLVNETALPLENWDGFLIDGWQAPVLSLICSSCPPDE
jgi:hypothetical protein